MNVMTLVNFTKIVDKTRQKQMQQLTKNMWYSKVICWGCLMQNRSTE
jgi:hypothetical protein